MRRAGVTDNSSSRIAIRALQGSAGTRLIAAVLLVSCALGAAANGSAHASEGAAASTATSAQPPLPESDYAVRPVCGASAAPASASCLALQLVPLTGAASAHTHRLGAFRAAAPAPLRTVIPGRPAGAAAGLYGLRPQDVHSAYGLPLTVAGPSRQTIAIVDAYDDPSAEADLAVFDAEFGLPECTVGNGCFRKVNEDGASSPLPAAEGEWAMEIALDVETAHAVCQECRIVLVEASSALYTDLEAAEQSAVAMGANEISNSWGGGEPGSDSEAFNHPGVAITVASGDYGYHNWDAPEGFKGITEYPASSPHVVAVGGTRLTLGEGGAWASETVWNGDGATGGGCSARFEAPPWQRSLTDWSSVGCEPTRAVADVAADADPYSGMAIYDSTPRRSGGAAPGWQTLGGTSLASPIVAASFALAGGDHARSGYAAQTLYENALADPGSIHPVTEGSNGECTKPFTFDGLSGCTALEEAASCAGHAICLAGPGYNGPAGVGTPDGMCAFERLGTCTGTAEPPGQQPASTPSATPTGTPGDEGGPVTGTADAATQSESSQTTPPALAGASGGASRRAQISRLVLSVRAIKALQGAHAHGLPVSELAFSYLLSRADRVRVTLAVLVAHGGGASRWRPIAGALHLRGHAGRNDAREHGASTLAPGRYRLTLEPNGGRAHSIELTVR